MCKNMLQLLLLITWYFGVRVNAYISCQHIAEVPVIIAIDESSTIDAAAFEKQLSFVSDLLEDITQRFTIGVIAYHDTARIIHPFVYLEDDLAVMGLTHN